MQKPLTKKGGKANAKAVAANRHGKALATKKGRLEKPSKKAAGKGALDHALSVEINSKNETEMARRAVVSGGALRIVQPPEGTVTEVRGPKPKKEQMKKEKLKKIGSAMADD